MSVGRSAGKITTKGGNSTANSTEQEIEHLKLDSYIKEQKTKVNVMKESLFSSAKPRGSRLGKKLRNKWDKKGKLKLEATLTKMVHQARWKRIASIMRRN